MKKTLTLCMAVLLIACGNHAKKANQFPKPGTVVAHAEEPIKEELLNHFSFSVDVIADSNVDSGVYDISTSYGPDTATGKIAMPKDCEDAKPVVRKGAQPYTWIIGFVLKNDTVFHDYYEIKSNRFSTNMRYIKAYSY